MVLIVSDPADGHVGPVADCLQGHGARFELLDLASLPRRARVTIGHAGAAAFEGTLAAHGGRLRLQEVSAVWWRRPRPYEPDPALSAPHAAFAFAQLHEAMAGLWSGLDVRWVNQPWADQRGSHKTGQLLLAQRLGLAIPQTIVTTDPEAARTFLADRPGRRFVWKALEPTARYARPTALLTDADLARLDALRLSPAIIQEYVEGVDLRVTVVGDELFTAEIDARRTASPQDFRPVYAQCRVAPAELPRPVADGLRRLVAALGLSYAAIDLRRADDGRHLFLEVNPAGQWLFVEQRTGQPIAAALARTLAGAC